MCHTQPVRLGTLGHSRRQREYRKPQQAAGKARWRSGGELDRRRRGWRDGQLRAERVAAEGEREHPETSAYEDWPRGGEEAEMMTQKRA